MTGRHASVSAKASPRQVGFLGFWRRFAPGGAVAELVSVQCLSARRCRKSMESKNRTRLFSDSVSGIKWMDKVVNDRG